MSGWNGTWFFFVVVSFLIYIIARGDLPKWKQILTQPLKSQKISAVSNSGSSGSSILGGALKQGEAILGGSATLQTGNALMGTGIGYGF